MDPRTKLFIRTLVKDEEYSSIRENLKTRIKDEIVSVETPDEAFRIKLKLDVAHSFFEMIESIARETEGEDDDA